MDPLYDIHKSPSLFDLFINFLRLGTTSFGGPAMIAYIRAMTVEKKKWLEEKIFQDGVALCQVVPGATVMQTAAYVGLRVRGIPGAIVSFIGFGLPAFCLMMILSAFYLQAYQLPAIVSIFNGFQAIIVAVIANAAVSFGKSSLKNWKDILIAIISASMFVWGIHPIIIILTSAFTGFVIYDKKFSLVSRIHSERNFYSMKAFLLIILGTLGVFLTLFFAERKLFTLAILMARIDLFAFGGGFSSIPIMYHEVVKIHSWMDGQTFMNGIALGQITPGPIVITATFIGYLLHGPIGGLVATISVFLPSLLIVIGIVPFLDRLRDSLYYNIIVRGILSSFVGLLLSVTLQFAKNLPFDLLHIALVSAAFVALFMKIELIWVILTGFIVSIFLL
jgi:chromate transporter